MRKSEDEIAVVVLAAGQGKRLKSSRAKVLHDVCGRPMLDHVLRGAAALDPARLLVVVGNGADQVEKTFADRAEFVLQAERRGTGHAVQQTIPLLEGFNGRVLILYGDTPLIRTETLAQMIEIQRKRSVDLVMLTAIDGAIPGRIVRDAAGRVARIVEAQDASEEELLIPERNTGVYLVEADLLREGLGAIRDDNRQGEFYVTDIVEHAVKGGRVVETLLLDDAAECLGVNSRADLAAVTATLRRRIAEHHMAAGVTLIDPERSYIDIGVEIGRDTVIEPGCVIQGDTVIGERVHLKAHTVVESSCIENDVEIGPSARLRPNSHLMSGVRIGNFVEIKNSVLGPGTKSSHLTYIGDADVGAGVNFGCGTVVVNYDGIQKFRTKVGDHVFIGCNANLIAPVTLNDNSFIAAGTTVSRDVPEDALAVARTKQTNIEGWVARRRKRKPAKDKE